jgi:hypothetical protein
MASKPTYTSKPFNCSGGSSRITRSSEFHGVYEVVGPDGNAVNPNKGRIWKAAYHDGRALLNVSKRLQKLAQAGSN